DADRLGVADVQVPVRLRRKACLYLGVAKLVGAHILGDDLAEKVGGSASVVNWNVWAFRIQVGHSCDSLSHWRAVLKKSGAGSALSLAPGRKRAKNLCVEAEVFLRN